MYVTVWGRGSGTYGTENPKNQQENHKTIKNPDLGTLELYHTRLMYQGFEREHCLPYEKTRTIYYNGFHGLKVL